VLEESENVHLDEAAYSLNRRSRLKFDTRQFLDGDDEVSDRPMHLKPHGEPRARLWKATTMFYRILSE
jgi:hypothetical protein